MDSTSRTASPSHIRRRHRTHPDNARKPKCAPRSLRFSEKIAQRETAPGDTRCPRRRTYEAGGCGDRRSGPRSVDQLWEFFDQSLRGTAAHDPRIGHYSLPPSESGRSPQNGASTPNERPYHCGEPFADEEVATSGGRSGRIDPSTTALIRARFYPIDTKAARKKLGQSPEEKVVLFVGNLKGPR